MRQQIPVPTDIAEASAFIGHATDKLEAGANVYAAGDFVAGADFQGTDAHNQIRLERRFLTA